MSGVSGGAAALRGWVWCGAALLALPALALADDEAREWLKGMTEALATRNYQGEFLHVAAGSVEKLRILHRFKEGRVAERLVSLTGNGREIVRNDTEVQCYLPDQRKVVTESRTTDHGALLGTLPNFDENLEANYRLAMAGRSRSVIGRNARIVAVQPRDGFRYGYRLWIDEQSRMPVRTDLCDPEGNLIEQVLFTSLEVGALLPDSAFRPDVDASGFTWIRQGRGAQKRTNDELAWRLLNLPPGFHLSSSGEQVLPGSDHPVTHLVLSDGLASVSVFIEGPPAPPRLATAGEGRVGSSFAYSRIVNGHQVTAVGEVPARTVQFIATGVAPGPAPRPGLAPVASGANQPRIP
jgi:sigma-E factor negative regulatory protein RseB